MCLRYPHGFFSSQLTTVNHQVFDESISSSLVLTIQQAELPTFLQPALSIVTKSAMSSEKDDRSIAFDTPDVSEVEAFEVDWTVQEEAKAKRK